MLYAQFNKDMEDVIKGEVKLYKTSHPIFQHLVGIFDSGVSREPYKSLDPFFSCSALSQPILKPVIVRSDSFSSYGWLTILGPGWRQVAVQYSTNS